MKKIIAILSLCLLTFSLWAQKKVHVGDILCTDNTTVSIDDFAASGKKALGVVFFVDDSGKHGLAVRLQSAATYWNKSMMDIEGLTYASTSKIASQDLNGLKNTKAIIKSNATPDTLYAAYVASVMADREDGVEGWFLPSYGQMDRLFRVIRYVDRSFELLEEAGVSISPISGKYWTSTGCSTEKAMGHILVYKAVDAFFRDPVEKNKILKVRSVREF